MALGADRYASRADTLVFLGCLGLSLAAMSLPPAWRDPVASAMRQTILAPLLELQRESELLRTSRSRFDAITAQRDSTALAATWGLASAWGAATCRRRCCTRRRPPIPWRWSCRRDGSRACGRSPPS